MVLLHDWLSAQGLPTLVGKILGKTDCVTAPHEMTDILEMKCSESPDMNSGHMIEDTVVYDVESSAQVEEESSSKFPVFRSFNPKVIYLT